MVVTTSVSGTIKSIPLTFKNTAMTTKAVRLLPSTKGWFFTNPQLLMGIGLTVLVQLIFTYAPFMNHFLHTAPLEPEVWARICGLAGIAFVLVEVEKKIRAPKQRGG
jgi:magnesium-transporting ATPase (P-type)